MLNPLAWFHWDPDPTVFTIPYFDHPLRWYGLLFALGFVLGFFILLPLLRQKLLNAPALMPRDIADWKLLTSQLKAAIGEPQNPLTQALSKTKRQQIAALSAVPDAAQQQTILGILSQFDRNTLEALLPRSINSISVISYNYADKLVWFIIIGTIIGARLGHVFFYEWPRYSNNLIDIFKIWEGGLASHGGTIGVLLAVYLYTRWTRKDFPEFSFLKVCDLLTIPVAFAVAWIRIGNFMNQEILGKVTTLPWAVVFGHPADFSAPAPRHPVVLYEALLYISIGIILFCLWKWKKGNLPTGLMIGLFFILLFGFRFLIEFVKEPQSMMIDETWLQTSQLLSLPLIFLGIVLVCRSINNASISVDFKTSDR
jgi:prolipoprotein diacylglyceryl transferase